MALDGINGVTPKEVKINYPTTIEKTAAFDPILKFSDSKNAKDVKDDVPDGKIITENFKNDIMSKLDTSKSKKKPENIKYYLGKLIEVAQKLNGVQKNNLKPNGTPQQIEMYNKRIKEDIGQMKDYTELIGCGLSVFQDSKTGLYKLCVDNKLYDIPERKVEILPEDTEDMVELVPKIVY